MVKFLAWNYMLQLLRPFSSESCNDSSAYAKKMYINHIGSYPPLVKTLQLKLLWGGSFTSCFMIYVLSSPTKFKYQVRYKLREIGSTIKSS